MFHLAPEYIYTSQGLQPGMVVSISDDGRIASITSRHPGTGNSSSIPEPTDVESLNGMALLPGFVNVHSHIFQRVLRGHTHRPLSQKDTFWTWRNAMYAQAQQLTPDSHNNHALSA